MALGLDYVYGQVLIKQKVDLSNFGQGAEADLKVKSDGHGLGVNYALFVAWKPWLSLGASVRSNVHLSFRGTASFSGIDPAVSDILQIVGVVLPESTGMRSHIELPWNMNFGVAFHGLKKFTFAVDLSVAFWESYEELRVKFDCVADGTCYAGLNADAVYPKEWKTSYQVSLGAEYRPIKPLALRIGYGYMTDPTNPKYYDAINPDGNRHMICAGLGYRAPRIFKADLGYMFIFWHGHKNNEVGASSVTGENGYANGRYDVKVHLIALTLGLVFDKPKR